MAITYNKHEGEFHLFNDQISYIIKILPNGQLGHLYFGKHIKEKESFGYLIEGGKRSLAAYVFENDYFFSLQHTRQEYPSYGTTDFHYPAIEIIQENGSHISNFEFNAYHIFKGKKKLEGLPATYVEHEDEADTLEIVLLDQLTQTQLILSYTIYAHLSVITRSAKITQVGSEKIVINRAMSMAMDLPDAEYEMLHFAGAWGRERALKKRRIEQGVQSIHSLRGTSSAEHNPFIILKRENTDENMGEAIGYSLVYSGNFLAQVEVDSHQMTRVLMGIHPDTFSWKLCQGESFQTPEVVIVYSDEGLNKLSQTYHDLYRKRLARGRWRDKERPIVCNSWEATEFDFDEKKILAIAKEAAEVGVELFVLDDGWFGNRNNDKAGLGDWYVNKDKLPEGLKGLSDKISQMGMKFGIWIEPEMVNKDSDLYRQHSDWLLCTPGRRLSPSRNQYVLNFARTEVRDYIYEMLSKVLREAHINYVKWDMNRYLTECYSSVHSPEEQGKVMHEYILGVYALYEKLTLEFPNILFESCSSGGARFDPGMLYYSSQVWTSDDTDAGERIKIQYSTSYAYPLAVMSNHVSRIPNLQTHRMIDMKTRGNVAYFGVAGYEMDIGSLQQQEKEMISKQIKAIKRYRSLMMDGDFYRLLNPYENTSAAWMTVSKDKAKALVGYYQLSARVNPGFIRLKLRGLDVKAQYNVIGQGKFNGDELMYIGLVIPIEKLSNGIGDFSSIVYELELNE